MKFIPHFQEDAAIEFFKYINFKQGDLELSHKPCKLMPQLCFVGFAIIGLTNAERSGPSRIFHWRQW